MTSALLAPSDQLSVVYILSWAAFENHLVSVKWFLKKFWKSVALEMLKIPIILDKKNFWGTNFTYCKIYKDFFLCTGHWVLLFQHEKIGFILRFCIFGDFYKVFEFYDFGVVRIQKSVWNITVLPMLSCVLSHRKQKCLSYNSRSIKRQARFVNPYPAMTPPTLPPTFHRSPENCQWNWPEHFNYRNFLVGISRDLWVLYIGGRIERQILCPILLLRPLTDPHHFFSSLTLVSTFW